MFSNNKRVSRTKILGEGKGRGHNPDLEVPVPPYNHKNLFIPAKEFTPASTNIGPRNLALEGRNQDGSVVTLCHNEAYGGAVHLQL